MAELTVPQIDFSTLGNLGQIYQQAQARHTLADLGTQLSNGTIDYNQAAGKIAQTGNLAGTLQLLALGQKQKQDAAGAAAIQSAFGYGGTPSPAQPSAQPQQPAGPLVPNDSNAIPGTVGMNQRLADLSQDFIQDNPGTSMTSGVRTPQQQAALYADRANNPNPVAAPGTSLHEQGLAVDIGGMTPQQRAQLPQYGLAQPVAGDPVHVQLAANAKPAADDDEEDAPAATSAATPVAASGPTREQIAALYSNPNTRPLALELLKQKLSGGRFTQETDKDGNIWNVNNTTGQRVIALKADDKSKFGVIGADQMGNKQYGFVDPSTGKVTPYSPQGGAPSAGGFGDMSKSGADYLATVPKAQALTMQGMVDGTVQPPSSFALAKPYWQNMLAGAKNIDPNFDANTWATRHKLSTDMASSGNSTMGGILSNGKSAFAHLADLSASMADLGNASHNFPGGGAVASAQNWLGNSPLSSSANNAKIKAINDNLGHYGQESTKFYSGTGGGVEERMNALKEMNPVTTSSAEMAAYLEKEKSLMTDRMKQKEDQIRDTMGEQYLQKHPVFTPQLQQTVSAIDGNIAKLKGTSPTQQAKAGNTTKSGISWSLE